MIKSWSEIHVELFWSVLFLLFWISRLGGWFCESQFSKRCCCFDFSVWIRLLSDCLLLSSARHLPYPFWCLADFNYFSRVFNEDLWSIIAFDEVCGSKVCGSLTFLTKIRDSWSSVVMVSNEDLSLICQNLLGLSCDATDRVLDVCLYILQSSNQLYKVSFVWIIRCLDLIIIELIFVFSCLAWRLVREFFYWSSFSVWSRFYTVKIWRGSALVNIMWRI